MRIILGMTWKELLRKKVMLMTLIMTAVFLLAFWFVADTLGSSGSERVSSIANGGDLINSFSTGAFIVSMGFFFGAFVIAFLVIFSSFSSIAGEAEQGVMQALLPRPLPRWKWYLGRWLGYVTLGLLYALLLFTAILLIADAHASIPRDGGALIKAYLLFASVVPLLISLSMLGSGLFSAVGNGVFMTMLYGAGWLGGMIDKLSGSLGLKEEALKTLNNLTGIMSLLMPADGLQRKMSAELFSLEEMQGMVDMNFNSFPLLDINSVPSNSFIIYAALYAAVVFAMGMLRFQRKDL
ncbi:ABC transporter permease subunit [Paenibacillus sonchi]|uniref:ABC transporter permease subunit n=1 Tax=Paenibacillus sonchi TaxID=373687 RepID=A0A974P9Y3_9BACL|nr:ABC transporter permease subunit [Paenibacillus sonchi]MCE3200811.1 ABC transporter permease [Paenibacillus sonchi]QQZ59601.1 ABC transporter permease subunit [Paenibacillus sonchi]